jgi:hypothetical protein
MNLMTSARRRAAAVGITCAAIVLPSAGMAAASQATRAAAPAVPKCSTSQLRVWLGIPGSSASGMTAYELELSNVSKHACMLIGFPGVAAVGVNGHHLGSPAVRDHSDPTRPVILAPAVTSHVFLRIFDVTRFAQSACHVAGAIGLKVVPPNDRTALVVPFTFKACVNVGPKFLFVRATVAHTGIPGFST